MLQWKPSDLSYGVEREKGCILYVSALLEEKSVSYVTERVCTTDAVYRETFGKAERVRKDECIAVEMELAGMQAVCEYHGLTLKVFLFASDCLGVEEWHNELLGSLIN